MQVLPHHRHILPPVLPRFSGFADEAYRLADALRARGRKVVAATLRPGGNRWE